MSGRKVVRLWVDFDFNRGPGYAVIRQYADGSCIVAKRTNTEIGALAAMDGIARRHKLVRTGDHSYRRF